VLDSTLYDDEEVEGEALQQQQQEVEEEEGETGLSIAASPSPSTIIPASAAAAEAVSLKKQHEEEESAEVEEELDVPVASDEREETYKPQKVASSSTPTAPFLPTKTTTMSRGTSPITTPIAAASVAAPVVNARGQQLLAASVAVLSKSAEAAAARRAAVELQEEERERERQRQQQLQQLQLQQQLQQHQHQEEMARLSLLHMQQMARQEEEAVRKGVEEGIHAGIKRALEAADGLKRSMEEGIQAGLQRALDVAQVHQQQQKQQLAKQQKQQPPSQSQPRRKTSAASGPSLLRAGARPWQEKRDRPRDKKIDDEDEDKDAGVPSTPKSVSASARRGAASAPSFLHTRPQSTSSNTFQPPVPLTSAWVDHTATLNLLNMSMTSLLGDGNAASNSDSKPRAGDGDEDGDEDDDDDDDNAAAAFAAKRKMPLLRAGDDDDTSLAFSALSEASIESSQDWSSLVDSGSSSVASSLASFHHVPLNNYDDSYTEEEERPYIDAKSLKLRLWRP